MTVRVLCLFVLGLAVGGLGLSPASAADAKSLAGTYTVKGTNPDKSKYENTATITFKQGNTVEITYKQNKMTWIGLGKLDGDTLRVTFERAVVTARPGKGEYQVKPNGRLVGEWREKQDVWHETWVPQK